MRDLDLELEEYRDIKDWLAGKKPPAMGRTWRRKMQIQIQKVLPRPTRSAVFALAPICGVTLVRLAIPLLFINTVPLLVDTLADSRGLTPGLELQLVAMVEMLHIMTVWVRTVGNVVLAFSMLLVVASWVVAGE